MKALLQGARWPRDLGRAISDRISRAWVAGRQERDAIVSLYVHGIFLNEKEATVDYIEPDAQRGLTKEALRRILEYFLFHGFEFITPVEIVERSSLSGKCLMLTFDDGYFSNSHALPLLKEYGCSATFFISTKNVIEGKAFWWDVIYRERARRGATPDKIKKEIGLLRNKDVAEIDRYIGAIFGNAAHRPISDIDRPFTPDEIKDLCPLRFVHIGNHTHSHALLSKCQEETIREEIEIAQHEIKELTGLLPIGISYPSGSYDERVVNISKELGLKVGMTIRPQKTFLPIDIGKDDLMLLGRYEIDLRRDLESQLDVIRSDFQPYYWFRNRKSYLT